MSEEDRRSAISVPSVVCDRCSLPKQMVYFGFPRFTRIQIFQKILNDLFYSVDGCVLSNDIADVLHQDHGDVMEAMRELYCAYSPILHLTNSQGHAPVQITEFGRTLLNMDLLLMVRDGMYFENFVALYPGALGRLAISENWVEIKPNEIDFKMCAFPGPNAVSYERIHEMLTIFVKHGPILPSFSMHKFFEMGLVAPGPVIPILEMRKSVNFPVLRRDVLQIWFNLIDQQR